MTIESIVSSTLNFLDCCALKVTTCSYEVVLGGLVRLFIYFAV